MEQSSSQPIGSASRTYGWLFVLVVLAMLALGWAFMEFSNSYIHELKQLSQSPPEQAFNASTFFLVVLAMVAGFPAVGIGTYVTYQGNQIRQAQQIPLPVSRVREGTQMMKGPRALLRGRLLILCGGLLILSGLVLPLIAWWASENL